MAKQVVKSIAVGLIVAWIGIIACADEPDLQRVDVFPPGMGNHAIRTERFRYIV